MTKPCHISSIWLEFHHVGRLEPRSDHFDACDTLFVVKQDQVQGGLREFEVATRDVAARAQARRDGARVEGGLHARSARQLIKLLLLHFNGEFYPPRKRGNAKHLLTNKKA